jgi:hypothetical protein
MKYLAGYQLILHLTSQICLLLPAEKSCTQLQIPGLVIILCLLTQSKKSIP